MFKTGAVRVLKRPSTDRATYFWTNGPGTIQCDLGGEYADKYSTNHGGVMLWLLNNYKTKLPWGFSDIQRWKRDKLSITEGWNQRGNPIIQSELPSENTKAMMWWSVFTVYCYGVVVPPAHSFHRVFICNDSVRFKAGIPPHRQTCGARTHAVLLTE